MDEQQKDQNVKSQAPQQNMQPGQTVQPAQQANPAPDHNKPEQAPVEQQAATESAQDQPQANDIQQTPLASNAPTDSDTLVSPAPTRISQPTDQENLSTDQAIAWEASEYIHHEKDPLWYGVFGVVTLVGLGMLYLILQDILSIVVIALMAVAIVVFANRRPRTLRYGLSDQGIMIDDRYYSYDSFRSFSVMQDGGVPSIMLDPLQRLMPPITMYFDPQQGDQIVDTLSNYLPHQDREPDLIDRFARRIRF